MSTSLAQRSDFSWDFPEKLQFLFEPCRTKVAHGGRGGAKSWGFARALLVQGLKETHRTLCTREVQNSIRDSVHRLLSDQIELMGLADFYDVTRDEIRGKNGTLFIFSGLSNLTATTIKSYEGVTRCWIEEGQSIRARSLEILIPTIRAPGSEIWVSMNPDLDTDAAYQHFIANPPLHSKVVEINWRDNPWFPEILEEERQEFLRQVKNGIKSRDDYDNIWEGKPRAAVHGAIFGKELMRVRQQGRIKAVPWDSSKLVYASFDLGKGDATAIWFWQQIGGEIRFIDYFEDSGEDLPYYMQRLQAPGYKYDTIFLPHDARQDRLGHPKTIEQQFRSNGFPVKIVANIQLEAGLNASRTLLARCLFDEGKCNAGLEALRHYRWGYNQALDELKPIPVHDWASHGSDAFRYASISITDDKPRFKKLNQRPPRGIV